jgi:hypothetical protein
VLGQALATPPPLGGPVGRMAGRTSPRAEHRPAHGRPVKLLPGRGFSLLRLVHRSIPRWGRRLSAQRFGNTGEGVTAGSPVARRKPTAIAAMTAPLNVVSDWSWAERQGRLGGPVCAIQYVTAQQGTDMREAPHAVGQSCGASGADVSQLPTSSTDACGALGT